LGTDHKNDNEYWFPGGKHWPPTPILLDSQAAVAMAETAKSSSRTRHIDRHFHLVRHGQASGKHKLQWVSASDQVADIGTKNITFPNLKPMRDLLFVNVPE